MRHRVSLNNAGSGSSARFGALSLRYPGQAGARTTAAAFALWLAWACPLIVAAAPPGAGGPPPLVTVAPVTERDVNPPAEYVGHVEAIQTVDLRARVEGFLEEILFTEGADVRAEDVLYVIEQAPYKAKVDADKARLAQAEANLYRASQRLKRLQDARPESVRATDMDNAVADELQAKAQIKEAKAALASSALDLSYTRIKAPISGRIGLTAYTRGNLVNPSSGPLARVVQLDPVRVIYSVSENDLAAVQTALHDAKKGKKSRLLTPALRLTGSETFEGTGEVSFVDNQIDPTTGTIAVRAVFANGEGRLIPGQYVTVLVTASLPKVMPVVPQAAVLVNQEGRFVLVVDNENRVSARPITIGPAVGTVWAVESGLQAGDRVIVEGIQKAQPGETVQVKTD
jgi:RND family efflux transporter MFP subunit